MVLPADPSILARLAPPAPRCGMDRHVGPFEPLDELRDWLGADWVCCQACRSTITSRNARGALASA